MGTTERNILETVEVIEGGTAKNLNTEGGECTILSFLEWDIFVDIILGLGYLDSHPFFACQSDEFLGS